MDCGSTVLFPERSVKIVFNRGPIKPTEYKDISDTLLRDDLQNLASKLKREVLDKEIRLEMPLAVFERNWLSLFIGKVASEDQPYGFPVVRWIREVTGNPYTWVDIKLPDGTVVYSVPPLLNSKAVQINHVDFYHHIMEIQAMADHGASAGQIQAYRDKNIMQFIGADKNAETYMGEINKMAVYHGYKPFTSELGLNFTPDGKSSVESPSEGFGKDIRVDDF